MHIVISDEETKDLFQQEARAAVTGALRSVITSLVDTKLEKTVQLKVDHRLAEVSRSWSYQQWERTLKESMSKSVHGLVAKPEDFKAMVSDVMASDEGFKAALVKSLTDLAAETLPTIVLEALKSQQKCDCCCNHSKAQNMQSADSPDAPQPLQDA